MKTFQTLRYVISLYAFILVIWGFYRFLFKLPETVEELILKPIIWLVPLWWILNKEKGGPPRLAVFGEAGWTTKNLMMSIYLAIGLGIIFAAEGAIVNSIKYGGSFNFLQISLTPLMFLGALGLSFVTAISEETVFRGFIFSKLWQAVGEWKGNLVTSIAWALVHVPVTIFVFRYDPAQILTFLFLTFIFGVASAFVYARTGNVISSVLLHVFWEWPIILFR